VVKYVAAVEVRIVVAVVLAAAADAVLAAHHLPKIGESPPARDRKIFRTPNSGS
jgi:hypothetical protein